MSLMDKQDFRKIFGWMCWITLLIFLGWLGLLILDFISWGAKNAAILAVFAMVALSNFAVDSLMKENPDHLNSYFITWLIGCGIFFFIALTIFVWLP